MAKTNGSEQRALKRLQQMSALLDSEVIPRLRGLADADDDDAAPPDRPQIPELPDAPSDSIPSAARDALADLFHQVSSESASAIEMLFSSFDADADEDHEGEEPAEDQPADDDEDDVTQPRFAVRAAAAGGRVRVSPGVPVGPTGRLLLQILNHYPRRGELTISSAYRPQEKGSHHSGLSYKGSPTAALDVVAPGPARMRDIARWLYDRFAGDIVELIHTTPFNTDRGFYVKNQVKYPGGGVYGSKTRAEHRDHVHFAASRALAQRMLGRLKKRPGGRAGSVVVPRAAAAKPAAVWGWDASGHDWKRGPMDLVAARRDGISFFTHKCSEGHTFKVAEYKNGMNRARAARMPVMGAYHVLWPGNPIKDARFFFNLVNSQTPWWKTVPWIWQLDAEKFKGMPRPPSPAEAKTFLNELRRLAGNRGYFVAYAPRWLYGDTFRIPYDLWASDYSGSGAPRNFKVQYRGVPQSSWRPYSGRKPRMLQFASDATIGRQRTCDANRFNGTLSQLIALTKHKRAAAPGKQRAFAASEMPASARAVPVEPMDESVMLTTHG